MLNLSESNILFYPCTLVGYARVLLLAAAVTSQWALGAVVSKAWLEVAFGLLIGLSILLDLLDGYLARRFGHDTNFGKLFDLVIDLTTHTVIWIVSELQIAFIFIVLEWTAGLYAAAFSLQPNAHWKKTLIKKGPALVKTYFANNQRNALSAYGNMAHFVFPLSFYVDYLPVWIAYLALPGLILYEIITTYMLYTFIRLLLKYEN